MQEYYESGGAKNPAALKIILNALECRFKLARTLDVGCGNGALLAALTPYTQKVTAIDASAEAVELAKQAAPNVETLQADVERPLPFASDSFETVFMLDVIEHLKRPIEALEEVRRVLVEGGHLVVTTPNANSPLRLLKGRRWFGLQDHSHLLFFSAFSLEHALKKTGFRPLMKRTEAFTGTPADAILRALRVGGTLFVVVQKQALHQ